MATDSRSCAQVLGELWPLSGAHILHLYLSEAERQQAVFDFVSAGLARGERICVVHDHPVQPLLADFGLRPGAPGDGLAQAILPLVTASSREFYLHDGVFSLERVYRKWHELYRTTRLAGLPAYQALGEVLPDLERVAGGPAVVLYEKHLNGVIQASPPTCVICQYDARAFQGATLVGTLRAHPLVLVGNRILPNPLYEPCASTLSH